MLPSVTSEKITLTYPLFAADFLDADHLIVGGGGGPGNSGVGNKITLLDVSKSTAKQSDTETNIKQLAEYELSRKEDACMSLAVVRPTSNASSTSDDKFKEATIFAGVNSTEDDIKTGKNKHFRTFTATPTSLQPGEKKALFVDTAGNKDTYQRLLRTRGRLTALASGGGKTSEIVLLDTATQEPHRRAPVKEEVADIDIVFDGETPMLGYCTRKTVHVMAPADDKTATQTPIPLPPLPGTLRSLRFITHEKLLLVHNRPQRAGAEVLLVEVPSGRVLGRKTLHRGIGAVTSMDAVALSGSTGIAALSGADSSIEVLAVEGEKLKPASTHRNVDPFQITKLCFSPAPPPLPTPSSSTSSALYEQNDRSFIRLASVAMSNAVVVLTLPLLPVKAGGWRLVRARSVMKQTVLSGLGVLVCVVVMAVVMQGILVRRGGFAGLTEGLGEEVGERWESVVSRVEEAVKQVRGTEHVSEQEVEGLLKGMEAGSATDPFDSGFDAEELKNLGQKKREEKEEAKGTKKDEL